MRKRVLCCMLTGIIALAGITACTGRNASDASGGSQAGNDEGEQTVNNERYTINEGVRAYLSDREGIFCRQEDYVRLYGVNELNQNEEWVIRVDDTDRRQEVHGFGASFTDTAAHVLMAMPEEDRNQAMIRVFDREKGIGVSLIRNCIGASDFALKYYTYDDMPRGEEDWELAHFDFSHDLEQIIPLTKQALEINPDARVILSPWTAPLWMKTEYIWSVAESKEKTGKPVALRPECYEVYAKYLAKAVKAYEDAGVPVYALTPQNEMFASVPWPSMYWDWQSEADFINNNLRPALEAEGLDTKILVMDHNYSFHNKADFLMTATMQAADGVAYHDYEGEAEAMLTTRESFPDKLIYVTEASNSAVVGDDRKLLDITSEVSRALRCGASGYVSWNLALGTEGGPTWNDVNLHCTGMLACDPETKEITYDMEYYAIAHFSKFIHDGAVILNSTDTGAETGHKLLNVVAANPNGSMVAVLVNSDIEEHICKIVLGDRVMEVNLGYKSVVTLTWDGNIRDATDVSGFFNADRQLATAITPLPETAKQTSDFEHGERDSLTVALCGKTTVDTEYVTCEAEDYAMGNLCSRGENATDSGGAHMGGAKYLNAQTAAQIMSDGIDGTRTPYIELTLQAADDGNYDIMFGMKQGKWGMAESFQDAYVIVECNGTRQQLKRSVEGSLPPDGQMPVTLSLQKGTNIIRATFYTGDTVAEADGSSAWMDYDTITLKRADAEKLTFRPVSGVAEAENAEYYSYGRTRGEGCSGGHCLGGADYAFVEGRGYTFDSLTAENIEEMPYVKYTVQADSAGSYRLGIMINSGADRYTASELKELGVMSFAMAVNGGEPRKVEFVPEKLSYNLVRLVDVELEEGENTILLTCTTAEYLKDADTNQSRNYRLCWIDHDALILPGGVHGLSGRGNRAYGNTNVTDPQLEVIRITGMAESADGLSQEDPKKGNTVQEKTGSGKTGRMIALSGCAAATAGVATVYGISGRKRTKKTGKKETGQ